MQRITLTLDDDLVDDLDAYVARSGYSGRSEAMRDLLRAGLLELTPDEDPDAACVGALVYVFDHHRRELAQRLTNAHHDHHDLSLATTHVHLDHESCLEVALLRGAGHDVRHFAEHVMAERGVQHGRLVVVPVSPAGTPHTHEHGGHAHTHLHVQSARRTRA